MRITIDAIPLLVRSAGVKNYLFHWIVHLRRLLGEQQVGLFPLLHRLEDLDHEGSIASRAGTLARQGLLFGLNLWPNHAWDLIDRHADVFHATKLRNPPRRPRLTATLHDMTCWLMPEFHQAANIAAEKQFAEQVWKRAAGLIAVSESTRTDAVRVLGLNSDKIAVIHPGVAVVYFQAGTEAGAARRRYNLVKPYALYVGTVEPRKNLDRLLNAWQALPISLREHFDLVLAGPEGWHARETLARLRNPTAGVRYLGYVPEPGLPGITAGAELFVYPSLYEGFGFPVAQAMAAGVPVVTSNISSLPQITAGAAALIDPHSEAEIRATLEHLLTSPSARTQLTERGAIQALQFRWENSATRSVEFFKQLLGSA
jgi:glycosyltransferase involved in cell wall biosynthesis